jgi:uncharacterized membrane protein (UPF0127 family)
MLATCCINLAILFYLSSKSGPFFFIKNLFVSVEIIFIRSKIHQKRKKKKKPMKSRTMRSYFIKNWVYKTLAGKRMNEQPGGLIDQLIN